MKKEYYIKRAKEAGIKEPEKMRIKDLERELKEMKDKGLIPNNLGGARPNSGTKPIEKDPLVTEIKRNHALEEVTVIVSDRATGTVKQEKKLRLIAMLDMLGQKALKEKDVSAANAWFDRILGKPKQGIEHEGEIKSAEQSVPTPLEVEAAEAYYQVIKKNRNG